MPRRLVWFNPSASGSPYSIPAGVGSFTLTGNAAGLVASRKLAAGAGAYTLTGYAATLKVARVIGAGVGTFTLTGNAATFGRTYALAAGVGSFTLTGNAVTFNYTPTGTTYSIPAGVGTFTLTGNTANLLAARKLSSAVGSYTLTGNAASLIRGYTLSSGIGTFTLTGNALSFARTYALAAESGSFILSGKAAEFSYSGTPETSTKGGAARGKRKKRRKLIDYAEQPITQIIHNLESDRKLSQGVIENTRQVIKSVEAPILEDVGPLKETLQSLLKEKQAVKTVTQQIADLTTKPVEEPVKEVVEYATKEDVQALNVKLDLILKRLDNLSNDMEIIAALAAS